MLKLVYYQVDLILFSFVEIKVSLTGLSKFKEGVSKIRELLSSRKGINLHLQEIKMDLSRGNEKVIGVFVSGSELNSWAGFQRKPLVKWREWAKWKTFLFLEENFISL